MAGRITKLTPKLQRRICKLLREGNTRKTAAICAGIGVNTFVRWMRDGKRLREGIYWRFRLAVKRAEEESVNARVATIKKAGRKNWTAAAWWLERRRSEDWGRKDGLNIAASVMVQTIVGVDDSSILGNPERNGHASNGQAAAGHSPTL